jgi:hypothetical protein
LMQRATARQVGSSWTVRRRFEAFLDLLLDVEQLPFLWTYWQRLM